MAPFGELTRRGQARRLRAVAFAALERFGIDRPRLRLITNAFNAVFRVDAEGGRTHVLRVNLPHRRTLDEITAELAWIAALSKQSDVGVPVPRLSREGTYVVTTSAPGVPEPRHSVLFDWIGGVDLAARLTDLNVAALGELMAAMHAHALTFEPPPGLRVYDDPFPLDDRDVRLVDVVTSPDDRALCRRALERIDEALARLAGERPRIIHADLHQDNVRVSRGRLYAIDFDDTLLGHPIQDIGATLWNLRDEPRFADLCDAFRRGYERRAAWPETTPDDIEAFVADRSLMLIDYTSRDTDPADVAGNPVFIRKELRHLRRWLDGP